MYIYSNSKCMCVFLISPVPIAEPLTSELIDTPVFYNLAPRRLNTEFRYPSLVIRVHFSNLRFMHHLKAEDIIFPLMYGLL